jgi:hypothetical protein
MGNIPWQTMEPLVTIHPFSMESIGPDLAANGLYFSSTTSAAWQVANAALLIPFTLTKQATFVEAFWYNGATVTYNVDVGVYDTGGNLLGHTGSIVSSGTSAIQIAALTASFKAGPGSFYLAIVASSTSMTFTGVTTASITMLQAMGCAYIAASDLPLATGKTIASLSPVGFSRVPMFGVSTRSVL